MNDIARRLENWARYNRWEQRQPPSDWTFKESLDWMERAIQLARQSDPEWGQQGGFLEHCQYLALIRDRLKVLEAHG